MKFVSNVLVTCILLAAISICSFAEKPRSRLFLEQTAWAKCSPAVLKISVRVITENRSARDMKIGKFQITQEKLWQMTEDGELKLVSTSDVPDKFSDNTMDDYSDISDVNLEPKTTKEFVLRHYVYLSKSIAIKDLRYKRLFLSFHFTNVLRDGSYSDYWSDLTALDIPSGCE